MDTTFACANPQRLQRLRGSGLANAIDHLVVVDGSGVPDGLRQRLLLVRLLEAAGVAALGRGNVTVAGGVRVVDPEVRWAVRLSDLDPATIDPELSTADRAHLAALQADRASDGDAWLAVLVSSPGDHSRYHLRLREGAAAPAGFDPVLSEVTFSFKVGCPSPFDCAGGPSCPAEHDGTGPELDYLARDFASFRRLLYDRLALIAPPEGTRDDASRDPATLRATMVETLAYAADELSYFQDAVATEAYLGTCRTRPSLRRHARLLGYPVHEGCNARAFVHLVLVDGLVVQPAPSAPGERPRPVIREGATFLTRLPNAPPLVAPIDVAAALAEEPAVFEALAGPGVLAAAHNAIELHTWGDADCCLERGATTVDVIDTGDLHLAEGDFVLLEQTHSPTTGLVADADPARRHVVRLTSVGEADTDPLFPGISVRRLGWHDGDALPFTLPVTVGEQRVAVARGNVVLVDHGRTIAGEPLALERWGALGGVRTTLEHAGLSWVEPVAQTAGAAACQHQDPRRAAASVVLTGEGERWGPVRDLLGSLPSARAFAVETENDGRARLRFGDDISGRRPAATSAFTATYRIGNGPEGHVGAEAIAHVVADVAFVDAALSAGIQAVRNPLPASGGLAPEAFEEVVRDAPEAFRVQQRAVTIDDWIEVTQRHPAVQRAVAELRWTGSWHTVRVTVDPVAGHDAGMVVDELRTWLQPFRLAGVDLEVVPPAYVPLDIVLTVCAARDRFADDIAAALQQEFSTSVLPDGRRGFFHPDAFTFGHSVWLSQVISRCMAVPGVAWVDATPSLGGNRFKRWGHAQGSEVADGRIRIGALEIARCDSDPAFPDRGRIAFMMEGGT